MNDDLFRNAVGAILATLLVVGVVGYVAGNQDEARDTARGVLDAMPGAGMINSDGGLLAVRIRYTCPGYSYIENVFVERLEDAKARAAKAFPDCTPAFEVQP